MTPENAATVAPAPTGYDGRVAGWPDGSEFPIIIGQFSLRGQSFCVAAGFSTWASDG